ncbi:MAG: radical SAM protein [Lachnospiraceae bacterium]|nr:radical SAM protein [Lachnospiraceae bacterium]
MLGRVGKNSGLTNRQKKQHLEQLAAFREETLRPHPILRTLFIEMTQRCNEHCLHCGSLCDASDRADRLSYEEIVAFLKGIKQDFDISRLRLCVTGGEPLLRDDFFDIMDAAHRLGFSWGMTSNATLITPEKARLLKATGMRTVSVSVDGLEADHEWFRQSPGSYQRTMTGIQNLLDVGFEHVQITTVVHHRNFKTLEAMYDSFSKTGVRSWRVINMEPMGRALEHPELLLTPEEYRGMFDFIAAHRTKGAMTVGYGCSHFLGVDREREVRPWYFLCNAGVYTASITVNGDIVSCLDLPRRPELVEGNIREHHFKEIWENGFAIYRTDFRKTGKCADCADYRYCAGDSFHSWDFDRMEPRICMRDVLKGK